MLLLGYILVTCHKNNIVTLHVTFMLYRRNKTCLLGDFIFRSNFQVGGTTYLRIHLFRWSCDG